MPCNCASRKRRAPYVAPPLPKLPPPPLPKLPPPPKVVNPRIRRFKFSTKVVAKEPTNTVDQHLSQLNKRSI